MQSYLTQHIVTFLAVRSSSQTTWEQIWSSSCCVISLYQHHKSRAVAQSPSCLSHKIDSPKKSQVVVYTHNTGPWRLNLKQTTVVSSLSKTLFFAISSKFRSSCTHSTIHVNSSVIEMHAGCSPSTRLLTIQFHPWTQTIYYLWSRSKMEFSEGLTAQKNFEATPFINCSTQNYRTQQHIQNLN